MDAGQAQANADDLVIEFEITDQDVIALRWDIWQEQRKELVSKGRSGNIVAIIVLVLVAVAITFTIARFREELATTNWPLMLGAMGAIICLAIGRRLIFGNAETVARRQIERMPLSVSELHWLGASRLRISSASVEFAKLHETVLRDPAGFDRMERLPSAILLRFHPDAVVWIPQRAFATSSECDEFGRRAATLLEAGRSLASPLVASLVAHAPVACPKCGYNLQGSQCVHCPECGTEITVDKLAKKIGR